MQAQQDSLKQKVDIKSGYLEIKPELPDAIIYTKDAEGQVYIVHEGVEMWCDQAYVYLKDNFVKAYGSVRITQGDTVTMTVENMPNITETLNSHLPVGMC